MKSISIITILLTLIFSVSAAFAFDEATVQAIDEKAASANTKADSNNSRIQALELKDIEIEEKVLLKVEKVDFDPVKADVIKVKADVLKKVEKVDFDPVKEEVVKVKADVLRKVEKVDFDPVKEDVIKVKADLVKKVEKELFDTELAKKASKEELEAIELTPGPQGDPGPAGPAGPEGPAGPAGPAPSFSTWQSEILTAQPDDDPNTELYLMETANSFCVTSGPSIWIYSGVYPNQESINEMDIRAGCTVGIDQGWWVLYAQAQKGEYGNATPWVYCQATCLTWE
jgi:hypothetical protein